MRITTAALGLTFGLAVGLAIALGAGPLASPASAQTASTQMARTIPGERAAVNRRPRVRIYRERDERGVYPSYNPGPNAVRDCTAHLVQEFRPSGTVIVPRMNCFWRRG